MTDKLFETMIKFNTCMLTSRFKGKVHTKAFTHPNVVLNP